MAFGIIYLSSVESFTPEDLQKASSVITSTRNDSFFSSLPQRTTQRKSQRCADCAEASEPGTPARSVSRGSDGTEEGAGACGRNAGEIAEDGTKMHKTEHRIKNCS